MVWYPNPEETISFSKMPIMEPLPVVEKSQANCALLWGWASPYEAAVRLPTVYYTFQLFVIHRRDIVIPRVARFFVADR